MRTLLAKSTNATPTDEEPMAPSDIAVSLLQLQQKLDALDRAYNEEVDALHQQLTELKTEYVRWHQAQQKARKPKRQPHRPQAPETDKTKPPRA